MLVKEIKGFFTALHHNYIFMKSENMLCQNPWIKSFAAKMEIFLWELQSVKYHFWISLAKYYRNTNFQVILIKIYWILITLWNDIKVGGEMAKSSDASKIVVPVNI